MARKESTLNNSTGIRIAVDAMGGDYGPKGIIKGAFLALSSSYAPSLGRGPVKILLVGDPNKIEEGLQGYESGDFHVEIVNSEGKIGDDEHPVEALRNKPNASVVVATRLVKQGVADAMVSMGSTGASMASASLILGTLEGLERPCVGGPFLGLAPRTVVVDTGSNVDCRPPLLLSFAILGCVFARVFLSIENPRVGLLSVGAEEAKGNRQVREGYQLFKDSAFLNFIGNVEGMDFFTDRADVIVCDGFVGNILMKFTEGLGDAMASYLRMALEGKVPPGDLETLASKVWELTNLPKRMGGPLFGVNGVVVVGHGASKAAGVAGAIDTARRCVEMEFVKKMRQGLNLLKTP